MVTGTFVAYYRVSTKKQGASGLGLEAQKSAVQRYLDGGKWSLLAEFTEIESGKDDKNRPQLQEALRECRMTGAKLIVSRLDRLSRDLEFIAHLQKSSVKFVVADMPDANHLTVQLLAALAQHEREMISTRYPRGPRGQDEGISDRYFAKWDNSRVAFAESSDGPVDGPLGERPLVSVAG